MSHPLTLWQTIDRLAEQVPFTHAKVEAILAVPLVERSRNEFVIFYESEAILLADQVSIKKIDLRLNYTQYSPGFLVFGIDGACIPLSQVRAHYDDLRITSVPHGHSLREETVYTATFPWGTLNFGFREVNPGCLAGVSFDPYRD